MNQIKWTLTGKEHTEGKEKKLTEVFSHCTWEKIEPGKSVAYMPGAAINNIMKEMRGRPINYAISFELAPLGLYGMEFGYKNAIVKSFWLDDGVSVCCLASVPQYK